MIVFITNTIINYKTNVRNDKSSYHCIWKIKTKENYASLRVRKINKKITKNGNLSNPVQQSHKLTKNGNLADYYQK